MEVYPAAWYTSVSLEPVAISLLFSLRQCTRRCDFMSSRGMSKVGGGRRGERVAQASHRFVSALQSSSTTYTTTLELELTGYSYPT
jgi:hypothetical protein